MTTLVIATRNAHKVKEIQAILGDEIRCLTLNDFPGAPEVVEDADTFAGNASKKAVALANWLRQTRTRSAGDGAPGGLKASAEGMMVLADDSGLEVDALQGAPGVHSARFAALGTGKSGNSAAADNNAKLLRVLQAVPTERRSARFRCVIAVAPVSPSAAAGPASASVQGGGDPAVEFFEGACEGRIEVAPRGRGGFGYDPLFVPVGFARTFGELPEETKNQLSHRARALGQLKRRLARS